MGRRPARRAQRRRPRRRGQQLGDHDDDRAGLRPHPASYRVIAVADALDQQAEPDETNDVAVSSSLVVAR
jgi:hypothetical protein